MVLVMYGWTIINLALCMVRKRKRKRKPSLTIIISASVTGVVGSVHGKSRPAELGYAIFLLCILGGRYRSARLHFLGYLWILPYDKLLTKSDNCVGDTKGHASKEHKYLKSSFVIPTNETCRFRTFRPGSSMLWLSGFALRKIMNY